MTDFAPLPIDRLACDGPLPAALYERRGANTLLLLAAGRPLTAAVLDRLRDRNVTEVIVERAFLPALSRPAPAADEPVREPIPVTAGRRLPADAVIRTLTRPAAAGAGALPARLRAAADRRAALAEGVGELFAGVGRGGVDGAGLRALSNRIVADLCEDFDLFARLGLARAGGEEPPGERAEPGLARLREQAVRTAHLALATGAVAGLRRGELADLAAGCLAHDAGMTRIAPGLWDTPRKLDAAGFAAVAEHPRHTLELLKDVPGLSAAARAVAVQVHERADGSGYPFGLSGGRAHRLARLAQVADAYCGMTADRPHRPALGSHAAVRTLLAGALRGRFDADAVRAFLETVGVFPPGCGVTLSDGRCGRVSEPTRDRPAGPRVELWDPLAGRFTGETVDLAARPPLGAGAPDADAERPHVVAVADPRPSVPDAPSVRDAAPARPPAPDVMGGFLTAPANGG